jgi:hypothetical protein
MYSCLGYFAEQFTSKNCERLFSLRVKAKFICRDLQLMSNVYVSFLWFHECLLQSHMAKFISLIHTYKKSLFTNIRIS